MAIDHALAACLGDGEAVLRLYGWSQPTVSFGRNEPARAQYGGRAEARWRGATAAPGTAAGAAAPLDFVRRPTGGRAVVHARELTYAVVAPLSAWGGLRAAYVAIHEALEAALRALGAPVQLAEVEVAAARRRAEALRPDAGPCFRSPAPGEIVAAGRKLVGSAQARLEGALLQHGSILLDDDQGLLAALGAANGDRPAALRELLGDVSIDDVTSAVAMSLRETFGGRWAPNGYRAAELDAAERLESERYGLESWTWRR
jgi:lipoate-protein ligase A